MYTSSYSMNCKKSVYINFIIQKINVQWSYLFLNEKYKIKFLLK